MQAFSVQEPRVKDFMQHLFVQNTFNSFEVRGITLRSFAYFEISREETEGYCTWEELRPYVRHIIKGREKPKAMKVVLAKSDPWVLHLNAAALFVNITYDGDKITITTAVSQKNFALNKEVDIEWDSWVAEFLKQSGIVVAQL